MTPTAQWLTLEDVLHLHTRLLDQFGGSQGIRDSALLESALAAPLQTFAGEELYPDVLAKAAQLGFSLIRNRAFLDGNKRIGTHAMLVTLTLNGIELEYTPEDLLAIVLAVASGKAQADDLLDWIEARRTDTA